MNFLIFQFFAGATSTSPKLDLYLYFLVLWDNWVEDIRKKNIAKADARGGVRDVAFFSFTHEQTESNRI